MEWQNERWLLDPSELQLTLPGIRITRFDSDEVIDLMHVKWGITAEGFEQLLLAYRGSQKIAGRRLRVRVTRIPDHLSNAIGSLATKKEMTTFTLMVNQDRGGYSGFYELRCAYLRTHRLEARPGEYPLETFQLVFDQNIGECADYSAHEFSDLDAPSTMMNTAAIPLPRQTNHNNAVAITEICDNQTVNEMAPSRAVDKPAAPDISRAANAPDKNQLERYGMLTVKQLQALLHFSGKPSKSHRLNKSDLYARLKKRPEGGPPSISVRAMKLFVEKRVVPEEFVAYAQRNNIKFGV